MILVSVLTVMLGCSNPSLRVAYIDEVEERRKERTEKVYYSVLVKAVDGLDQEIYRIKLPGPVRLGEGKPENQNHAIIFTRGEGLQAIDMNQVTILFEGFYSRLGCV
jgi:callose synthase